MRSGKAKSPFSQKGGKSAKKPKAKVTKSVKSGVTFPVSRIQNKLRKGNYAKVIQTGSAVFSAAVVEYLIAEIMELSGIAASDNDKKRITPRHITLAVRTDPELQDLWNNVTIANGGVLPFIHETLLPRKTKDRLSKQSEEKNAASSEEI